MLSDRSYMRDNYPREKPSVLAWLIAAVVAGFVLQMILERWLGMPGVLEHYFGLSSTGLRGGRVWTLFSYGFLHSTATPLHVLLNLLGLYFIGRALEPMLGAKRFFGLFAAAVVAGGAAWTAANWQVGGSLLGASAGVFGLFMVFACFYPHQPVSFLLFFVVPVSLKPKHVAVAAVLTDLAGCLFYEVMGVASPFGFAHSAHLGGMAAGWIYYRYLHEARWRLPSGRADIELPRWMKKAAKAPAPAAYQVNVGGPGDLRADVDRILDKINSQGFGALSADEKRRLDEAKDLLSRR
jgi:membrane associated rhomboid family serine protease